MSSDDEVNAKDFTGECTFAAWPGPYCLPMADRWRAVAEGLSAAPSIQGLPVVIVACVCITVAIDV